MEGWYLGYTLRLSTPLLASRVDGDPNSVRTEGFVPGARMRGAVAGVLGETHPDFATLVLSGSVRFLNAYPCQDEEPYTRALPVPRSWRAEKRQPTQIHDAAAAEPPDGVELAAPPTPFVTPGAKLVSLIPETEARIHHQRDRAMGRATQDVGAVFVYEALRRGTVLHGLVGIAAETREEAERLEGKVRALPLGEIRLGRSRGAEYGGRAALEWRPGCASREVDPAGWSDVLARDLAAGDGFRLLLTADAQVRDPATGQWDPAALDDLVVGRLGGRAQVVARFAGSALAAGFNVKWGLALPQAPVAAAGTVLLLRATAAIPLADLVAIEHTGIGERRAEGLGACLFLGPAQAPRFSLAEPPDTRATPSRPEGPLPDPLPIVQARLFEELVDRAIARAAARAVDGVRPRDIPSPALLGRLRVPLRRGEAGLAVLRQWLDPRPDQPGRLRSPARRQLEDCRIEGKDLDQWIRGVVAADGQGLDDLARQLFQGLTVESWSLDGTVARGVTRNLARQARGRLVDAVLALLAKRARRAGAAAGEGQAHG